MNKGKYYPQPNSHRPGKKSNKPYGAYKDSSKSLTHNNSSQDLEYSMQNDNPLYSQIGNRSHRSNNSNKAWKSNDYEELDNFNYMIYQNQNWKAEKSSTSYDLDNYSFSSRNYYPDGRSKHSKQDKRQDNISNKSFENTQTQRNRSRPLQAKGLIIKEVVIEYPIPEPAQKQEIIAENSNPISQPTNEVAINYQFEEKISPIQHIKQSKNYYSSKDDMFSNNSANPSIYNIPQSPEAPKNKFNIPFNFVNQPDLSKPLIAPPSISTIDSVSALASKLNKESSVYLPKSIKLASQEKIITLVKPKKLKVVDQIFIPKRYRHNPNSNSEDCNQNNTALNQATYVNEALLKSNDDNEQVEELYPVNMNFDFMNTEGADQDKDDIKACETSQQLQDEICDAQYKHHNKQHSEADFKECNIENLTTEDNLDYHALKTDGDELLNLSGCLDSAAEDKFTQSLFDLLMSLAEEEDFHVQDNLIKDKAQGYDVNKVYTDMVSIHKFIMNRIT